MENMILKKFGKTGRKVSQMGVGTWKMGKDRKKEAAALKRAIELGVNFIDTAEMYGTEDVVNAAIKDVKRDELFIATKVSPHHFRYDDVLNACENSLSKLGLKYVDLYQLHWPNHSVPISETMRAMEELVRRGKIRYIGISNYSVEETKAAQEALKVDEIVSNQVEYSVLVRQIENDGLKDYCKKNGIEIIAYSPLARGALMEQKYSGVYKKLEEIGKKHDKSAVQVALNWLMAKDTFPIPKASDTAHIEEDIEATGFKLSKAELEDLDRF